MIKILITEVTRFHTQLLGWVTVTPENGLFIVQYDDAAEGYRETLSDMYILQDSEDGEEYRYLVFCDGEEECWHLESMLFGGVDMDNHAPIRPDKK